MDGRKPNQDQINQKSQLIQDELFLTKEELTLAQFKTLVKENREVRDGLVSLGVLRENEFRNDYDTDLDQELIWHENANEDLIY